jgi:hypothetical protein
MGATSVTGAGPGAANVTRGPGNLRNQYASLLDPHVVAHGTFFGGEGAANVVTLPSDQWDVPENLTIILSGKAVAFDKIINGDGLTTGFYVLSSKKTDIDYTVIKSPGGGFTPNYDFNSP